MKVIVIHVGSTKGFLGVTVWSTCGHGVTILGPNTTEKATEIAVRYFLDIERVS